MTKDYVLEDNMESEELLTVIEKYTVTPEMISDEILHKAKCLLRNYRHALWSIKSHIDEKEGCQPVMNQDLKDVTDILERYGYHINNGKLDERLREIHEIRLVEKMIALAMQKVMEYPEKGPVYCEVLELNYLVKDVNKEDDILDHLSLARSTYYKYKTEAIKVFGYCLWNNILPNLKKMKQITVPIYGNNVIQD